MLNSVSAKMGGWMSLAIGASVFSFCEILFFLGDLLRLAFVRRGKVGSTDGKKVALK